MLNEAQTETETKIVTPSQIEAETKFLAARLYQTFGLATNLRWVGLGQNT